jgi:hypothetical protein
VGIRPGSFEPLQCHLLCFSYNFLSETEIRTEILA